MDANLSTWFIVIIPFISHKIYLDTYGARLISTEFGIMFPEDEMAGWHYRLDGQEFG